MKALIFAGGSFSGLPQGVKPQDFDLIIAADKGYAYAEGIGLVPHIAVGDFDSLERGISIKSPERIRLNPEKDMTDTQEAISLAIDRGATEILVLGALGGRLDHTLANLQLLKFGLDRGVSVILKDEENEARLINAPAVFPKREHTCLSLIPFTDCRHVYLSGVYYSLTDGALLLGNTLGVSNEFTEDTACIDPGDGLLLVVFSKKDTI